MDFDRHGRLRENNGASVLQGEEFFFKRLISRNSSVGCSSRLSSYYRTAEGVPFKWEMQPGTPTDPPKEEALPPLSPPPAVLSLGLPKPRIDTEEAYKSSSLRSRFKFWKHIGKAYHQGSKKDREGNKDNNNHSATELDKFDGFDYFGSSDGEFMASPTRDSSSSTSSSFSFSNAHPRWSSSFGRIPAPPSSRDPMQKPYSCLPLNFTSILVSIGRRA